MGFDEDKALEDKYPKPASAGRAVELSHPPPSPIFSLLSIRHIFLLARYVRRTVTERISCAEQHAPPPPAAHGAHKASRRGFLCRYVDYDHTTQIRSLIQSAGLVDESNFYEWEVMIIG